MNTDAPPLTAVPPQAERGQRWRQVSRRIRKVIWRLSDPDDMENLLAEIRQGLIDLQMPISSCGVNVVDTSTQPTTVTVHSLTKQGQRYRMQSLGAGVVVGFWRAGEPVYRDLDGDDPFNEKKMFPSLACILDVPFSHGTLAVNSEQRHAFDDNDIELLQEMAELLGDGFRRLRELRNLKVRLRLREEVWRMRHTDDIVGVMAAMRESFTELGFHYRSCGLNLIVEPGSEVLVHHMSADASWTQMTEEPMPLVQRIWESGEPAYRRDLASEDPYGEYESLAVYWGERIRSVIDVPFSHGTLALNSTEPMAFTQDQVELLRDLAEVLEEGFRRVDDLRALEDRNRALEREVAERRRAEEQLERSLAEKVVLLKEIHHRVKNNLQVVSSLLNLRAHEIDDPKALASFEESRAQIASMALIHERLYESEDLGHVDCAGFVEALAANVFVSYGVDSGRVDLVVEVEPHVVNVDTAIHCGLVVHELVSNCLKHAFPDQRRGTVHVVARPLGERLAQMTVRDDGIGLPVDVQLATPGTLGLRLVGDLARQMHGTVEVDSHSGTSFTVHYPREA